MDLEFIKLEDNRECILLDEFIYKNDKYVVLVNSMDKDDFIIRKVENNELVGLKDKNNFNEVFFYYYNNILKEKKYE